MYVLNEFFIMCTFYVSIRIKIIELEMVQVNFGYLHLLCFRPGRSASSLHHMRTTIHMYVCVVFEISITYNFFA